MKTAAPVLYPEREEMREEAGKDIQLSQKQVSQTQYNLQLLIVFNLELDTQNQHG